LEVTKNALYINMDLKKRRTENISCRYFAPGQLVDMEDLFKWSDSFVDMNLFLDKRGADFAK
jgi:hypothetical protein